MCQRTGKGPILFSPSLFQTCLIFFLGKDKRERKENVIFMDFIKWRGNIYRINNQKTSTLVKKRTNADVFLIAIHNQILYVIRPRDEPLSIFRTILYKSF